MDKLLNAISKISDRSGPGIEKSTSERISFIQKLWLTLTLLAASVFFKGLNRTVIYGRENVPAGGNVLIVSNHVSLLDPILIPYILMSKRSPEIIWAPGKAELFQVPLLGRMLVSYGVFPVKRGGQDLSAMRKIRSLMQRHKVMLFPEGMRSSDGKLLPGNRMVGKLIYQVQPTVIPTAVIGTGRAFPKGKRVPRLFSRFKVVFGPPLELQEEYVREDSKETAQLITQKVMQAIANLLSQHHEP